MVTSVSDRLRQALARLGRDEYGWRAALAKFSQKRPGGAKILAQDLTYFMNRTPGRARPLAIDDLDDIAAYFRVSIGVLLGDPPESQNLTGDEQRMLHAFRALQPETRNHFLHIIEAASLHGQPRGWSPRRFTAPGGPWRPVLADREDVG
jgi:hypothetical protein